MTRIFEAYLVTNIVTGKQYIGITARGAKRRWARHLHDARKDASTALHASIRKHGESAFHVTHVASARTWANALAIELKLIAQYGTFGSGYNQTAGGQGTVGHRHTDTAKQRIADSHRGRLVTAETRVRMSQGQKGRQHPIEVRQKIAETWRIKAADPVQHLKLMTMAQTHARNSAAQRVIARRINDAPTSRKSQEARLRFLLVSPRAGELSGKLTLEQVAEIKSLLLAKVAVAEIVRRFGIGQSQVSNIKTGRCWGDVAASVSTR